MNETDRKDLAALKIEVKNNSKQLEKIITNDLPHIYTSISKVKSRVWYMLGILAILVPLVIAILTKVW